MPQWGSHTAKFTKLKGSNRPLYRIPDGRPHKGTALIESLGIYWLSIGGRFCRMVELAGLVCTSSAFKELQSPFGLQNFVRLKGWLNRIITQSSLALTMAVAIASLCRASGKEFGTIVEIQNLQDLAIWRSAELEPIESDIDTGTLMPIL